MKTDLSTLTVSIVEEYYNNYTKNFFNYMDDDITWIGPCVNQFVEGKHNMLAMFAKESNPLSFRMESISSKVLFSTASSANVLMRFIVYTYYPSGFISKHRQRVEVLWIYKKRIKAWKFLVMHVSNEMEMDDRDTIYPVHLDEHEKEILPYVFRTNPNDDKKERLTVTDTTGATFFIDDNDISYIKAGKGKFCFIFYNKKSICVRLLLDQLQKLLPQNFYRPHRSYIVNVNDISKITRYTIFLKDSTEIPIPEKKFNLVEAELNALLNSKSSKEK